MAGRRALALGLLALAGAGAAWWAIGGSAPDQVGIAEPPRGTFAGSEACAACHPKVYERWRGSSHFLNMTRPTSETVVGDFERDNVYAFAGTRSEMTREGDRWFMTHTDASGHTEKLSVDWTLGIVRHQAYLHKEPDGRLQVLPTYWNIEEQRWRDGAEGPVIGPRPLRPSDSHFWRNWGRTFNRGCIGCHTSQSRKGYDEASNRYRSAFDPAINCEACHGPSAAHVWAWTERKREADPSDAGLRSMAGDDLQTRLDVCAACHARKQVYAEGWHPGASLYDFFVPEVWAPGTYYVDGRSSNLNYRFVDYLQSGCFTRTDRVMDCAFCHPPHDLHSVKEKTLVEANEICTTCHLGHKTRLTAHTRHKPESPGSRCVACHMPPMDLGIRMTVRDHTINSPLPELTRLYGVPSACDRCHAKEGAAWAEQKVGEWFGEAPHFQAYRARILERARVLSAAFADAPERVLPVIALTAWLDDPERSVIERASAAHLLGLAGPGDPNIDEALEALLRHKGDPDPLVRFYTISSLADLAAPEARTALRAALKDRRRTIRVEAYSALVTADPGLRHTDAPPELVQAREEWRQRNEAVLIDDPSQKSQLALWYFNIGEAAKAERLLRSGIALTPRNPGVRGDLVQLLLDTGRLPEADTVAREIRKMAPETETAALSQASVLLARGNPAQAVHALDLMIRRGKATPLIRRALGVARAAAGLPPDAGLDP